MIEGLCGCGCGQATKVSDRNHGRFGYVKGKPRRFLKGHHHRLRSYPRGEEHPGWRGESASYSGVHKWLERNFTKSGICEECGRTDCWTDWSNIDHQYRRVREDWRELCRRCHRRHDQTITNRREN